MDNEICNGFNMRLMNYANHFEEGYRFQTNVRLIELDIRVNHYRNQGYDVLVEEKAFWNDGTLDPKQKAILIREKQKKG